MGSTFPFGDGKCLAALAYIPAVVEETGLFPSERLHTRRVGSIRVEVNVSSFPMPKDIEIHYVFSAGRGGIFDKTAN
jgi:hypothetical protein